MKKFLPFLFLLLFTGCKLAPIVPTGVEDVKFGNVNPLTGAVDLDMGLKIKNPNPVSITVYNLDLNVTVAGVPLGKIAVVEKFKIKKKSEEVCRVKVNATLKDLFNSIPKILAAIKKKQSDVELKGSVRVGSGLIKHTFPIDFKQEKVQTSQQK